jgi:hypothetical protein
VTTTVSGRQYLLDLKAALEALPRKRLIRGRVATFDEDTGEGEVCTVGALALWYQTSGQGVPGAVRKGRWRPLKDRSAPIKSPADVLDEMAAHAPQEWDGPMEMADWGTRLGMAYTLSWTLARNNDLIRLSAEERWQSVYNWVNEQLNDPDPHRLVRT